MLSSDSQTLGEKLYEEETGQPMSAPPGGMKYSFDQHMEFIAKILPTNQQATDFWKVVTRIVWFVMAIEKNPMLAMEIRESKDPTSLAEALEARCSK